jgi:hypothetical protein
MVEVSEEDRVSITILIPYTKGKGTSSVYNDLARHLKRRDLEWSTSSLGHLERGGFDSLSTSLDAQKGTSRMYRNSQDVRKRDSSKVSRLDGNSGEESGTKNIHTRREGRIYKARHQGVRSLVCPLVDCSRSNL